nr:hypothetical protein [uncultured Acetatifactor sp.]
MPEEPVPPAAPIAQAVPVAPTVQIPEPQDEVEIPDEELPQAAPEQEPETEPAQQPEETDPEEEIADITEEEVPLAAMNELGSGSPSWALLNLILTILTALASLLTLTFYFVGKRKDEDEDELKRKGLIRVLSILPAVFAVITFILTENMHNPMIIVDKWTVLMLLYAVVNGALAVFSVKKWEKTEEEM